MLLQPDVMDMLKERYLLKADEDKRFLAQRSEYHLIEAEEVTSCHRENLKHQFLINDDRDMRYITVYGMQNPPMRRTTA